MDLIKVTAVLISVSSTEIEVFTRCESLDGFKGNLSSPFRCGIAKIHETNRQGLRHQEVLHL
jgi:hypothetical protein